MAVLAATALQESVLTEQGEVVEPPAEPVPQVPVHSKLGRQKPVEPQELEPQKLPSMQEQSELAKGPVSLQAAQRPLQRLVSTELEERQRLASLVLQFWVALAASRVVVEQPVLPAAEAAPSSPAHRHESPIEKVSSIPEMIGRVQEQKKLFS